MWYKDIHILTIKLIHANSILNHFVLTNHLFIEDVESRLTHLCVWYLSVCVCWSMPGHTHPHLLLCILSIIRGIKAAHHCPSSFQRCHQPIKGNTRALPHVHTWVHSLFVFLYYSTLTFHTSLYYILNPNFSVWMLKCIIECLLLLIIYFCDHTCRRPMCAVSFQFSHVSILRDYLNISVHSESRLTCFSVSHTTLI